MRRHPSPRPYSKSSRVGWQEREVGWVTAEQGSTRRQLALTHPRQPRGLQVCRPWAGRAQEGITPLEPMARSLVHGRRRSNVGKSGAQHWPRQAPQSNSVPAMRKGGGGGKAGRKCGRVAGMDVDVGVRLRVRVRVRVGRGGDYTGAGEGAGGTPIHSWRLPGQPTSCQGMRGVVSRSIRH